MTKENISQEFRLKKIDETRNSFIKEINQNKLMSKKHKKGCEVCMDIANLLVSASSLTGCVSILAFASLVGIPTGITSSAIGLKLV